MLFLVIGPSQETAEFFDGQASVTNDAAHGMRIDWMRARNHNEPFAVRHDDVFALPMDAKSRPFQWADRFQMRNARNLARSKQ